MDRQPRFSEGAHSFRLPLVNQICKKKLQPYKYAGFMNGIKTHTHTYIYMVVGTRDTGPYIYIDTAFLPDSWYIFHLLQKRPAFFGLFLQDSLLASMHQPTSQRKRTFKIFKPWAKWIWRLFVYSMIASQLIWKKNTRSLVIPWLLETTDFCGGLWPIAPVCYKLRVVVPPSCVCWLGFTPFSSLTYLPF